MMPEMSRVPKGEDPGKGSDKVGGQGNGNDSGKGKSKGRGKGQDKNQGGRGGGANRQPDKDNKNPDKNGGKPNPNAGGNSEPIWRAVWSHHTPADSGPARARSQA